ncbi:MAG TPA: FAD-binding oxidoreductase [Vicinamibacterales bacterium]|nr:FAD-binding oxidoreductase [Vicinamibacterales bacterium]
MSALEVADPSNFLEDAAHYPGGHAAGVVFPRSAADVAESIAMSPAVLPIGAQSSLTGGATPMGELLISTSKLSRILEVTRERIRVEAGVTVAAMQEALAAVGAWFPAAPTFTGACAGGIVATNAAGATTFKYGSTRPWVESLTVVLADGTVLTLHRGRNRASQDGAIHFETRRGPIAVPAPRYRTPNVAKVSAGYYAAPGMDAVDLFIGSEGTLGIVTEVTFRTLAPRPQIALAFVTCRSEAAGLALVTAIRHASLATWRTRDQAGINASAIEHMDHRSLEILREDAADRKHNVMLPAAAEIALLIQLELPPHVTADVAYDEIQSSTSRDAPDTPLVRFCRLLDEHGVLDDAELAVPGDARRAEQLVAVREAVPAGVNSRVGAAKRLHDPRIAKTAADMIVPFEHFAEMSRIYREGFTRRGLDYAMWGHISDGNVHPNVLPHSFEDVVSGREAILEFGAAAARFGGCPLAEHGVGRNAVKQALLTQLYGANGIDEMRAVKRALDPRWKLAPGVIFEI